MERQSTSKLFRILIAIAAFFILCSSSILFAACDSTVGVKDHEHTMGTTAIAETEPSCTVAGSVTYKCTDEECTYVKTVITGLPTGHTFEGDTCKNCGITKAEATKLDDRLVTQEYLKSQIETLQTQLGTLATNTELGKRLTSEAFEAKIDETLATLQADLANTAQGDAVTAALNQAVQKVTQDVVKSVLGESGKDVAAVETALKNALTSEVVTVLETYLSGDEFLGTIMGETGFGGLQRMIEGYLGEESETMGALTSIQTYLTGELTQKVQSILTALQDGENGLAALAGDIAKVAEQITNGFQSVPTAADIATATEGKVEAYLTGEAYKNTLTGAINSVFTSAHMNELLGLTGTTLKDELDSLYTKVNAAIAAAQKSIEEKISGVSTSIDGVQSQLTSGTTGKTITELDDMLKKIYGEFFEEPYSGAQADQSVASPGLFGTSNEVRPNGLLAQVEDLWTKTVALGESVKGIDTELDAKFEALNTEIATIKDDLSALKTSVAGIATKLDTLTSDLSWFVSHTADFQKYVDDINAVYKAFHNVFDKRNITFEQLLSGLSTYLETALQNNYLEEAINAAKGLKNFLGTTDESGNPTVTLADMQTWYQNLTKAIEANKGYDAGGADHVHNWVLKLAKLDDSGAYVEAEANAKPVCLEPNVYVYVCSICGDPQMTKEGKAATYTAPAASHVLNYTKGLTDPADDGTHHYEPTCVNPGYVQGFCVNCDRYIEGYWSTYGKPTYTHHYVLEGGTDAKGENKPGLLGGSCTSVHDLVYHCETCGGAYIVPGATTENPNPSGDGTTPHFYYSELDEHGDPTGEHLSVAHELELYTKYAANAGIADTWSAGEDTDAEKLATARDALTSRQRYEALKDHINWVFQNTRTCVDPGLVVVECVDCGMRYAYSYDVPSGHNLVRQDVGQALTCTTDGMTPYYYCNRCGYYFQFYIKSDGTTTTEPVDAGESLINDGKTRDEYVFSSEYLRTGGKTGEVINSQVDTDHAELARLACSKPAYGHNFVEAKTHTVTGACGWTDKTFKICTVCGATNAKYPGETEYTGTVDEITEGKVHPDMYGKVGATKTYGVDGEYTWNPLHYQEKDNGTYYGGEPDFKNNLKALAGEGSADLQAVADKLEELGYAEKGSISVEDYADVDALIKAFVTGWNVTNYTNGDTIKAHNFAVVYVGHEPTCLTAQDYILVCKDCFTAGGQTFTDLFDAFDAEGSHYVPKEDNTEYNTAETILAAAKTTYTADETHNESDLSLSWKEVTGESATTEGVLAWLEKYGYLTFDEADDMNVDTFKALYTGKDWATVKDELSKYYGDDKNVINTEQQLPVAGHVFDKFIALNYERCVTGMHYVVVCSVCGDTIDADAALTSHKVEDSTLDADALSGGVNDLDAEWQALIGAEPVNADAVVDWLAARGYLNRCTAEATMNVGTKSGVTGVADDETKEALVTSLKELGKEWATNGDYIKSFYTKSNVVDKYTLADGEHDLALPVKGHNFSEFVYTVTGNCVMYAREVYFCTVCGQQIVDPGKLPRPEEWKKDIPYIVAPDTDDYMAATQSGFGVNDLVVEWNAVLATNDLDTVLLWLANHGYLNAERDLIGYPAYTEGVFNVVEPDSKELKDLKKFINYAHFDAYDSVLRYTAADLAYYYTGENATKEFKVNYKHDESVPGDFDEFNPGHTFEAIYVKSASCESDGTYVYVCTTCGMEEKPTAPFSYTIDKTDYPTNLIQATDFTLKADRDAALTETADDQSLFEEAVPESRRTEINEGKTDLEAAVMGLVNGNDTASNHSLIIVLGVLGYLNTIDDTMAGIGQAGYNKDAPYKTDWDQLYATIEGLITSGKITKVSDLFTGTNQTLDAVGTTVPVMNHLMKDGQGRDVTAATPLCTDFQDAQLTTWFKEGYSAEWKDGKWQQGPKFDMSMFDKATHPLNNAWYENAMKYGIIGACARKDCPQHTTDYANKATAEDGTYTAGYVAATDHQMSYEKFQPSTKQAGKSIPSINVIGEGDGKEHVYYNMKKVDEYPGESTAEKQAAMNADYLNLYTLQKVYNYQVIGKEECDARIAAGDKTFEYLEVDDFTQDWAPLTKDQNASCWVDLRCKWFHYTNEELGYTGTKCTSQGVPTSHTYPKEGDWNYGEKHANCRHGDLCYTCDYELTATTGHTLADVTTLTGDTLTAWKSLFKAKYEEAFNAVEGNEGKDWQFGLRAFMNYIDATGMENVIDGKEARYHNDVVAELWDAIELTLCRPTCEESGIKIYVCTGELEKYLEEGLVYHAEDWVEETDGLTHDEYGNTRGENPNATYYVEPVEATDDHHFVTHYYYLTGVNKNKEISAEVWNGGFNKIICLYGYYTKDLCDHTLRDGKTVCNHEDRDQYAEHKAQNHTLAPVEEYWLSGRYQTSNTERNAIVEHVCVICGDHITSVYGATNDGVRTQYNLATRAQIQKWNEEGKVDTTLDYDKVNAQEIRPEDYKKEAGTTGSASAGVWNHNANYTYTGEAELTLEEGKNEFLVGSGLNPQVSVAANATLTLKGTEADAGLEVWGAKLTIKGEDRATSVLDLTGLGKGDHQAILLSQAGTVLTLDSLTVKLGDTANSVIFPTGGKYGGSKVIIKNCVIIKEGGGAPIQTSQSSRGMCRDVEIEITDSIIVSKDDTALFVNEGGTSNMPAKVTATGSTFYGKNMGVVIRGGNATFTDCTFATETGTSYSGEWGSGTNIPVSAGIVIGNQNPVKEYGNANVTLSGCKFQLGTYDDFAAENEIATVAMTPTFSGTDYAIAVFGNETNDATCTVDYATYTAAGDAVKTSGVGAHLVLPEVTLADLGETPEQAAAELVESFAATGGVVTLPAGIEHGIKLESGLAVAAGIDTTVNLNGNQLDIVGYTGVDGTLTLEGGTVTASDQITVRNGGDLTLSGVEVFSTKENVQGWLIAAPTKEAKITITDSVLYSSTGCLLGVNAAESTEVTIILIDSVFVCDAADADGRFALLFNRTGAKLYAGGCTFYGTNGAAWIRGGEAHFMGCTFIGGNVATKYDKTTSGTNISKDQCAAVVVGDPNGSSSYGDANVEFVDCRVRTEDGSNLKGDTLGITEGTTRNGYDYAIDAAGNVSVSKNATKVAHDWTIATDPEKTETGKTYETTVKGNDKVFVVLANGTYTTTVEFSDIDTAKSFLGENLELKKGTNLYLENGATLANVSVSYKDNDGNEVKIDPVIELTAEEVEEAPEVIQDVATNGGKVVLPAAEEEGTPVTVEELDVTEGKTAEIELSGNEIELSAGAKVSGTLTISGGDIVATKVPGKQPTDATSGIAVGGSADASVTLNNVNFTVPEGTPYGVGVSQGATLTISDSVFYVENGTAITTSNKTGGGKIVLLDSLFVAETVYKTGDKIAMALLISEPNTEVYAGGCTFYGETTGAWIRAAKNAVFMGCTFIYGGGVWTTDKYQQGTGIAASAIAAISIGSGNAYGGVNIALTDCTLKSVNLDGNETDAADNFEDETNAKFEELDASATYTYTENAEGQGSLTKGDANGNKSWQLTLTGDNSTDLEGHKIFVASNADDVVKVNLTGLTGLGDGTFKVGENVWKDSVLANITITLDGHTTTVAEAE